MPNIRHFIERVETLKEILTFLTTFAELNTSFQVVGVGFYKATRTEHFVSTWKFLSTESRFYLIRKRAGERRQDGKWSL